MSLEVSFMVGHCLQGQHTVRMPSTLPFLAVCRT